MQLLTIQFWLEFGVLFIAALIGTIAVLPYSFRLLPQHPMKMRMSTLIFASLVQSAVLMGLAVCLGLWVSHTIGLGAPYVEGVLAGTGTPSLAPLAVAGGIGFILGVALLFGDMLFLPYWPKALGDSVRSMKTSDRLLASFYGGIDEEILLRLFGLSALAWLLGFIWHTAAGVPTATVFWTANIITTILFGLGHLPALKRLLGTIPSSMYLRSLLLNAPIGLVCGWLFWTYGIETAMIAHFCADIVFHVLGAPILLRKLAR